jgi:hypothetical protein
MRPLQNLFNVILSPSPGVILSPSPGVILSEAKDLGGLRINASEGSGFSGFPVEREILHPARGGVQNDKMGLWLPFLSVCIRLGFFRLNPFCIKGG